MTAVVQILNLDDVQPPLLSTGVVRLDSPHGRQAIADLHRLSNFGESCFCRSRFHSVLLQGSG